MDSSKIEAGNFNDWVLKEELNKWHKVDKQNFVPPPTSTNLILFTKAGSIYAGHYKGSVGFIVYGIGARELTDVEVTHWKIELNPDDFQKMLDDMEIEISNNLGTEK